MQATSLHALDAIIVPTDLDESHQGVFLHALALALVTRADLTLLHIGNPADERAPWERFPRVRATLARWGLLDGDAAPEAIAERWGIAVRKVDARAHDVAASVAGFVGRHRASLVVAGTGARRGLAGLLAPSVAGRVARETRLMTLYLPDACAGFVAAADGSIRLNRVVVAAAEHPRPGAAVALARELAAVFADDVATLDLVHAGAALPSALALPADGPSSRWSLRLADGPPAEAIAHAARDADLVVMTTAGRSGPFDALLGSTAERVVARASCPVWTVPADP